MSCLFISVKYIDIYPPSVNDFTLYLKDTYTADMMLKKEAHILETIKFNLNLPLVSEWYESMYRQNIPIWGYGCYIYLDPSFENCLVAETIHEV